MKRVSGNAILDLILITAIFSGLCLLSYAIIKFNMFMWGCS